MIDPSAHIRRGEKAVFAELSAEEGGVLLHMDSGLYYGVNPSGVLIWEMIDGQRTLPQIAEEFRARVDGAPADLEQQIACFLDGLRERNLIAG